MNDRKVGAAVGRRRPQSVGGGALDIVLPVLTENLTKFVGESQGLRELEEAYKALQLDPSRERGAAAAQKLADFFVSKGGVYAFVGRAARMRIATRALDEITHKISVKP